MKILKKLETDTKAAILAYTAIIMPIFLGFIALGLDIAAWHIEKRMSQNIADSAAVAASIEQFKQANDEGNTACTNGSPAYNAALGAAGLNNYSTGEGHTLTLNCPPSQGDAAGSTGAVEAIVTIPLPIFLSALVNVTAEGKQASSRAVAAAGLGDNCIVSLNGSNAGAIDVNGGSTVDIGCGMRANSNDSEAIRLNGQGSCVEASEVLTSGGANGDCYTPDPVEGVAPANDPFANLPEPSSSGCTFNNKQNLTGSSNYTLSPGTYCNDVSITTSGTVTFEPGIYIFNGADLSVGSHAIVIAEGVMIFFTNGSNSNSFNISSGATWTQTPPTSGTYEGVALYFDRDDDPYNINITGGSNQDITGIIYAPGQDIKYAGGSNAEASDTYIIADEITFTGNSNIANFDPEDPPFFSAFLIQGTLIE